MAKEARVYTESAEINIYNRINLIYNYLDVMAEGLYKYFNILAGRKDSDPGAEAGRQAMKAMDKILDKGDDEADAFVE